MTPNAGRPSGESIVEARRAAIPDPRDAGRGRRRIRAPVGLVAVLLAAACAPLAQLTPEGAAPAAYTVEIDGPLAGELRQRVLASSRLESLASRAPSSERALRSRVETDVTRLATTLRAEGYYAQQITSAIVEVGAIPLIRITIDPGPPFRLAGYTIRYRAGHRPGFPATGEDVALADGMVARARPIRDAETAILARLAEIGHPRAAIIGTDYVVDHASLTLRADVLVDAGPALAFGNLAVGGLEAVTAETVARLADWRPGTVYDARRLAETVARLSASGLFRSIVPEVAEQPDPAGRVDIVLRVQEAPPRSIGAGLAVTSGKERVLVRASWEHRNFSGKGRAVRLSTTVSSLTRELGVRLRQPHTPSVDRDVVAETVVARNRNDAFDSTEIRGVIGLEHRLAERWVLFAGLPVELSSQKREETTLYQLIGAQFTATYDTRDDLLNPTQGVRVSAGIAPWFSIGGNSEHFFASEVTASTYLALSSAPHPPAVLAVRGRYAADLLATTAGIPPSHRLYAGGGGSIRGYQLRSVAPTDARGDPFGGRSLLEAGLEVRTRLSDRLGIVPFVEGGQVFDHSRPSLSAPWQWGAGLGGRYFTVAGPIRFDIAFPVKRRARDDRFTVYLSIGQAF